MQVRNIELKIIKGDLPETKVDAIVNAANNKLVGELLFKVQEAQAEGKIKDKPAAITFAKKCLPRISPGGK